MHFNPGYDILGKVSEATVRLVNSNISFNNLFSWGESFRTKQVVCKEWLVTEISKCGTKWDKVLVLGSWNSILLYELMSTNCKVQWYDFVDIDPVVHEHRDLYFDVNHMDKNYSSIKCNALDYSEPHENYDLVINCSCEHMRDLTAEYGTTYALQSNDYTSVKEHINCVKSAEELALKNNVTDVLYSGTKEFINYNRFMVIGYYY